MKNERRKLSPAEVAAQLGVGRDTVIAWVKNGELKGANLAIKPNGRPRYSIDVADLREFEERRRVQPQTRVSRGRRARTTPKDVVEFF
jgi:excisionase family DNA binding protein